MSRLTIGTIVKFEKSSDVPKLPSHVVKDGAKWLLLPSKIVLDGLSVWPERQNNLTLVLHFMCILTYTFAFYGQFLYITDKDADLISLIFTVSLLILCLDTSLKRILLYVYRERLTRIISEVCFTFWPSNFTGDEIHKTLSKQSWYLCLYCCTYAFIAALCGFEYIILPYFERSLPLRTIYPFPWKESPYYELLYVWQSFISLENMFCVCGLDLFFVSLLFNCVAQFRMMRSHLTTTFEEAIRKEKLSMNSKTTKEIKVIVDFIKYHAKLLWICKEIDNIFTYLILGQFLTSIGAVCVSSFVATAVPEAIGIAFPYFFGHMCEIFIFCYLGNELINESTALSNAVFCCGWHLSKPDTNLQKFLVIIMARSQRPVHISAGGFGYYLCIPTFVQLIKFSFSVYTLLNSMMD